MSDTPKTDALFDHHVQENQHCAASERYHLAVQQVKELLDHARQLERALSEANEALMMKAQQCSAERLRANAAELELRKRDANANSYGRK